MHQDYIEMSGEGGDVSSNVSSPTIRQERSKHYHYKKMYPINSDYLIQHSDKFLDEEGHVYIRISEDSQGARISQKHSASMKAH